MANPIQNVDLPTIKFAFDAVQTLIIGIISVYVWVVTSDKQNTQKISELEFRHNKEIDELKLKQKELETMLNHMPDRKQISTIHRRIDELNTTASRLEGLMKGLADNNQLLLNNATSN